MLKYSNGKSTGALFGNAENAMRRLLYFGRESPTDSILWLPSRIPTKPSSKEQVKETKRSFVIQNQMARISLRRAALDG